MKKDTYIYVAIFNYAKDGISIFFPDLPGCFPCASSTEEALRNAKEALGLHLWSMEKDNDPIPKMSSFDSIQLNEGDIPILIEVFMPPIRDRINNRFVKKTLSLPAWLSAKADESGVNCSKLFQNALMEYLNIKSNNSIK